MSTYPHTYWTHHITSPHLLLLHAVNRGMAYLHSGAKTVIIHRDLKPR